MLLVPQRRQRKTTQILVKVCNQAENTMTITYQALLHSLNIK
jgi:hypothetical protein